MTGAPASPMPGQRFFPWERARPWLLFLLILLLYLPSVRLGFVYDDETLILREPRPDSLRAFTEIFDRRHFPNVPYYRPVTRLTFRLQHFLHDKNPAPFHLFNALLAGLTALAAYGLLRRKPFAIGPSPAFLAALLFASHPAASSCVYPICSGRETLLPAFLMLLALQAWLRSGPRWRAAAVILWTAALFAKEQAIVLPVLFLAADLLDLNEDRRKERPLRLAGWYGVMAAAAAGYMLLRYTLFGGSEFTTDLALHPWRPLLSYLYALQTAFVPFGPLVYEPPADIWFSAWRAGLALLAAAGLAFAAWRRRDRLGRQALFWAAWFVVIQLPTANLLKQEARFDERYVFLATLALPALAAALASLYWERPAVRRTVWAGGLALAGVLGAVSLSRAAVFKDDLAFSLQWARTSPRNPIAHNNTGNNWLTRGRLDLAEPALRESIRVEPALPDAHFNLGTTLFRQGRFAEAIAEFQEALRLDPAYKADYNLALALDAAGDLPAAREHYQAALAKEPDNADISYNLGLLCARQGEPEQALRLFREAADRKPRDPTPVYNIGVTYERMNRLDEALNAYREAKERDPRRADVRLNLGNMLFRKGLFKEAAAEYEATLSLDPADEQARVNLEAARRSL